MTAEIPATTPTRHSIPTLRVMCSSRRQIACAKASTVRNREDTKKNEDHEVLLYERVFVTLRAFVVPAQGGRLPRQVVKQLQDVGENAHRGDVGAGARSLDDEGRPRVALGREGDHVVAA